MAKAIMIFSGRDFGGVERRFSRLAAHIMETHEDFFLFATADAKKNMKSMGLSMPKARIITLDKESSGRFLKRKINRLIGLFCLFFALRRLQIKQIHFAMNPGLLTFLYALFGSALPPYSVSMVDSTFGHRKKWYARLFFRYSIARACAVDCLSPSLQDFIQHGTPKTKASTLHIAPCSFSDYSKVEAAYMRDIDVAMISRWVPGKGMELLESAVQFLPGLNIHVCGFGPLKPNIPSGHLYYAENSFSVLSRTKIFLSLQQYNNYPSQSLLEAMASGCAIIATDVGETRMLLSEESAILVPYDSQSLVVAIKKLINDNALRERLGNTARYRATETQTIEKFSDYFLHKIMAVK